MQQDLNPATNISLTRDQANICKSHIVGNCIKRKKYSLNYFKDSQFSQIKQEKKQRRCQDA